MGKAAQIELPQLWYNRKGNEFLTDLTTSRKQEAETWQIFPEKTQVIPYLFMVGMERGGSSENQSKNKDQKVEGSLDPD